MLIRGQWRPFLWFLCLMVPMCMGGAAVPAQAATVAPQFILQRLAPPNGTSYFVLEGQAGQTIHDQVRISNIGNASGTVKLYAADATTGATSGLVYLSDTDARHDVGNWLTLSQSQLTLSAGANQIVDFTVQVPIQASSGQHVGGIVAINAAANSVGSSDSSQITIQERTILAVQVNLPGASIEHLDGTGFSFDGAHTYQVITVDLHNSGNQLLKPQGSLTITTPQGKVIQQFTLKLDTFLPQTTIHYPVFIKDLALDPGTYTAHLALNYGHNQSMTTTGTIKVPNDTTHRTLTKNPISSGMNWGPILWGGLAVVMVALLALNLVMLSRRRAIAN